MEDLRGKQLGPYQVGAPLGEGGMAAVYQAYQPAMDRYVALKILPRHFASDPQFVARFVQEAKVLAKLQHPHILTVFDFGEMDGYTYLVMPQVTGGTLADVLTGQPLPLGQMGRIIAQVGDALDYAHTRGLIHRDVKPTNILLDERGNCLLTDFGLAKIIEGASGLTTTGGIIGTPTYMSPEQGLGQTLSGRSDIYSLGVVLYEMATGRAPYLAETPMAIVVKHINDPLPPPRMLNPALPEAVEGVILRALAKSPANRYATAGEMVLALQAASDSAVTWPGRPLPEPFSPTAAPTAAAAPTEVITAGAPLTPPPSAAIAAVSEQIAQGLAQAGLPDQVTETVRRLAEDATPALAKLERWAQKVGLDETTGPAKRQAADSAETVAAEQKPAAPEPPASVKLVLESRPGSRRPKPPSRPKQVPPRPAEPRRGGCLPRIGCWIWLLVLVVAGYRAFRVLSPANDCYANLKFSMAQLEAKLDQTATEFSTTDKIIPVVENGSIWFTSCGSRWSRPPLRLAARLVMADGYVAGERFCDSLLLKTTSCGNYNPYGYLPAGAYQMEYWYGDLLVQTQPLTLTQLLTPTIAVAPEVLACTSKSLTLGASAADRDKLDDLTEMAGPPALEALPQEKDFVVGAPLFPVVENRAVCTDTVKVRLLTGDQVVREQTRSAPIGQTQYDNFASGGSPLKVGSYTLELWYGSKRLQTLALNFSRPTPAPTTPQK